MSAAWTLRPVAATDVPALAELLAATMRDPWTVDMVAESFEAGSFGLLAEAEPEGAEPAGPRALAGFALLRLVGDEAELLQLAVDPRIRRRGLGRLLLLRALGECARRGVATIFLEVRAGNVPAIELYSRTGFVDVGHRARYYRDGEDARVMRLELAFPLPG